MPRLGRFVPLRSPSRLKVGHEGHPTNQQKLMILGRRSRGKLLFEMYVCVQSPQIEQDATQSSPGRLKDTQECRVTFIYVWVMCTDLGERSNRLSGREGAILESGEKKCMGFSNSLHMVSSFANSLN